MTFKITKINRIVNGDRKGEPFKNQDKIFIFNEDKSVIFFQNRFNKPYKVYKKELLPLVMKEIQKRFPQSYDDVKGLKWSWRQSAGCSMCPCSPGFIGDTKKQLDVHTFYVTVKITD